MIKASDLRIGNWVLFAPKGNRRHEIKSRFCQVQELHKLTTLVNDMNLPLSLFYESNDLQPIPLTSDILVKAGFSKTGCFYIKDHDLLINEDSGFWWTNSWEASDEFVFEPISPYMPISFLHQLQNLYFALTGQELTINL